MKNLLYLSLIFIVFSCNSLNDKTEYFEKRFEELQRVSPEKISLSFLEKCDSKNENAPFKNYTPQMINSQLAHIYKSATEDHLKLIIDILIYKEVLKNKKVSIEDLKPIVYGIENKETDKLDKIVIKSFELALNYTSEQIRIENQYIAD